MDDAGMTTRTGSGLLAFDLHGIVGIRVVGAGPAEARAVRAQLGLVPRRLDRPADITVRFVPRLRSPRLRYVEPGRSGFTDDGYFILSHRRHPVVARMPFDSTGGALEIECEHGARAVPMLEDWVRLVALTRGHVPLHASAFEVRSAGVLVAGGPHGGKTSCLLAFAQPGTRFISDDLVLLSGDGRTMRGLSTDLAVADWQLNQLPGLRRRLGPVRRSLLAGARGLERLQPHLGHGALSGLGHAAVPALRRRLKVSVPPDAVFDGVGPCVAPVGSLFLALSHASPEVVVEPADPGHVGRRLAAGLRLQLQPLFEHYLAYRFAAPGCRSELLESAEARAEALLREALRDTPVHMLRHPHPVDLGELRRAMEPFVGATPTGSAAASPSSNGSAAPASSTSRAAG